MILTTVICFIFTFIAATHGLACHTCDDPSDPTCNKPGTAVCSEKDTLCYTLKYEIVDEVMVARGCADNCEKTKVKQERMASTLEEDCCGSDLCNKDDSSTDEKVSSKIFTAATEKVSSTTETTSEGGAEPATKKTPKEVLTEVKPGNGSQLLSVNILSLLLTCCLHVVVYII